MEKILLPLKKGKLLLPLKMGNYCWTANQHYFGEQGPIIQSSALICLVKAHTFIAIIKHSNGAKQCTN